MNAKSIFIGFVALLMAGLTTQSCKAKEEAKSGEADGQSLLVVERQQTQFYVGDEWKHPLTFIVDVPVAGSQVLRDSVDAFLNEQLYQFMESQVGQYDDYGQYTKTKSFDEVHTDDSGNLLKHYLDIYQPYMKKQVDWLFTYSITILAQTDNFVTYGVFHYRCGAMCSDEMSCYTFSKKDGHRLRDIISKENLTKYFAGHKEIEEKYEVDDEDEERNVDLAQFWDSDCIALLEDQVLYVVNGMASHYTCETFDYKDILPFLSKEAQAFVNERGDKAHFPLKEWFMGQQLGQVVSDAGDTIYIAEREFGYEIINDCEPNFSHFNDTELLTYICKNGKFTPYEGFKSGDKSMSAVLLDTPDEGMYLTSEESLASGEGQGKIHSFDKDKRELQVRYLTGKTSGDNPETKLRIYRFDGKQFVDTGKDVQ